MAETAQDMSFALVPDPRILRRSYDWDETVAVQRMEGEVEAGQETNFMAAALMLEIGIAMAAADGKLDREEVIHVSLGLKGQFKLNRDEARKLEAYREILIRKPPTFRSLSGFVQSAFEPEQREALGQFLVGVAAVDGIIEKAERKALENAYKAFAVPVAKLHALLREIESQAEEPVVVQEAKSAPQGEVIPLRETVAPEPRVKLNHDLINRILGDTATVAAMIGEAMGDVEELAQEGEQAEEAVQVNARALLQKAVSEAGPVEPAASPPAFEGLEVRYHPALAELITRREWSRTDFDALARRHGVMPAAMVEVINSWTDERYGDFLIEEGDPYVVQLELLEAA